MKDIRKRLQDLELNHSKEYNDLLRFLSKYFPDVETRIKKWDQTDYIYYVKVYCDQNQVDYLWFLSLA